MITVIQRVNSASVLVKNKLIASIDKGVLIFVCFQNNDGEKSFNKFVKNLEKIKIFSSQKGINTTIKDARAQLLVVPEFTLAANFKNGRPSFSDALQSKLAKPLFSALCQKLQLAGFEVHEGQFGADMQVQLENNGPVTFVLSYT